MSLTWHYVADGDESSVLQTGKIAQQLPIKHAVPLADWIVLEQLEARELHKLVLGVRSQLRASKTCTRA